jgi:hypothetical protein
VVKRGVFSTPFWQIGEIGLDPRLQGVGRLVYLEIQDDDFLQPILVYVPLLAHGSGFGGVGSSEEIAEFQLIRYPYEPRPSLVRLLLLGN